MVTLQERIGHEMVTVALSVEPSEGRKALRVGHLPE